jgi:hypothetical protein
MTDETPHFLGVDLQHPEKTRRQAILVGVSIALIGAAIAITTMHGLGALDALLGFLGIGSAALLALVGIGLVVSASGPG